MDRIRGSATASVAAAAVCCKVEGRKGGGEVKKEKRRNIYLHIKKDDSVKAGRRPSDINRIRRKRKIISW